MEGRNVELDEDGEPAVDPEIYEDDSGETPRVPPETSGHPYPQQRWRPSSAHRPTHHRNLHTEDATDLTRRRVRPTTTGTVRRKSDPVHPHRNRSVTPPHYPPPTAQRSASRPVSAQSTSSTGTSTTYLTIATSVSADDWLFSMPTTPEPQHVERTNNTNNNTDHASAEAAQLLTAGATTTTLPTPAPLNSDFKTTTAVTTTSVPREVLQTGSENDGHTTAVPKGIRHQQGEIEVDWSGYGSHRPYQLPSPTTTPPLSDQPCTSPAGDGGVPIALAKLEEKLCSVQATVTDSPTLSLPVTDTMIGKLLITPPVTTTIANSKIIPPATTTATATSGKNNHTTSSSDNGVPIANSSRSICIDDVDHENQFYQNVLNATKKIQKHVKIFLAHKSQQERLQQLLDSASPLIDIPEQQQREWEESIEREFRVMVEQEQLQQLTTKVNQLKEIEQEGRAEIQWVANEDLQAQYSELHKIAQYSNRKLFEGAETNSRCVIETEEEQCCRSIMIDMHTMKCEVLKSKLLRFEKRCRHYLKQQQSKERHELSLTELSERCWLLRIQQKMNALVIPRKQLAEQHYDSRLRLEQEEAGIRLSFHHQFEATVALPENTFKTPQVTCHRGPMTYTNVVSCFHKEDKHVMATRAATTIQSFGRFKLAMDVTAVLSMKVLTNASSFGTSITETTPGDIIRHPTTTCANDEKQRRVQSTTKIQRWYRPAMAQKKLKRMLDKGTQAEIPEEGEVEQCSSSGDMIHDPPTTVWEPPKPKLRQQTAASTQTIESNPKKTATRSVRCKKTIEMEQVETTAAADFLYQHPTIDDEDDTSSTSVISSIHSADSSSREVAQQQQQHSSNDESVLLNGGADSTALALRPPSHNTYVTAMEAYPVYTTYTTSTMRTSCSTSSPEVLPEPVKTVRQCIDRQHTTHTTIPQPYTPPITIVPVVVHEILFRQQQPLHHPIDSSSGIPPPLPHHNQKSLPVTREANPMESVISGNISNSRRPHDGTSLHHSIVDDQKPLTVVGHKTDTMESVLSGTSSSSKSHSAQSGPDTMEGSTCNSTTTSCTTNVNDCDGDDGDKSQPTADMCSSDDVYDAQLERLRLLATRKELLIRQQAQQIQQLSQHVGSIPLVNANLLFGGNDTPQQPLAVVGSSTPTTTSECLLTEKQLYDSLLQNHKVLLQTNEDLRIQQAEHEGYLRVQQEVERNERMSTWYKEFEERKSRNKQEEERLKLILRNLNNPNKHHDAPYVHTSSPSLHTHNTTATETEQQLHRSTNKGRKRRPMGGGGTAGAAPNGGHDASISSVSGCSVVVPMNQQPEEGIGGVVGESNVSSSDVSVGYLDDMSTCNTTITSPPPLPLPETRNNYSNRGAQCEWHPEADWFMHDHDYHNTLDNGNNSSCEEVAVRHYHHGSSTSSDVYLPPPDINNPPVSNTNNITYKQTKQYNPPPPIQRYPLPEMAELGPSRRNVIIPYYGNDGGGQQLHNPKQHPAVGSTTTKEITPFYPSTELLENLASCKIQAAWSGYTTRKWYKQQQQSTNQLNLWEAGSQHGQTEVGGGQAPSAAIVGAAHRAARGKGQQVALQRVRQHQARTKVLPVYEWGQPFLITGLEQYATEERVYGHMLDYKQLIPTEKNCCQSAGEPANAHRITLYQRWKRKEKEKGKTVNNNNQNGNTKRHMTRHVTGPKRKPPPTNSSNQHKRTLERLVTR